LLAQEVFLYEEVPDSDFSFQETPLMKIFSNHALAAAGCLTLSAFCMFPAQSRASEQQARHFEKEIVQTVALDYWLYLPQGYAEQADKEWPLVLFLHGAGERGTDLEKVKVHGIPKLVAQGQEFPFIAVSPQCPEGIWWDHTSMQQALLALLASIREEYRVDSHRIYLTGLSMGGFGSWALATEAPDLFAAVAPICGGGQPHRAKRLLSEIPIWIFHGGKDTVVDPQLSRDMYEALKSVGADVKLTIYPDAGHDSWTETYNNPEFFEWMLAQKRP
jgi:predicted peptidase